MLLQTINYAIALQFASNKIFEGRDSFHLVADLQPGLDQNFLKLGLDPFCYPSLVPSVQILLHFV